tara:strand:- start:45 stop:659 length:615 start_codon:yes stop_codon:yes gene_type:complete
MGLFPGILVICIAVTGCVQRDGEESHTPNDPPRQTSRTDAGSEPSDAESLASYEDERLDRLASLSFRSALNEDWGLAFSIVPTTAAGDPDLGIVRQWQGDWVAGYDSGFASSELIEVELIDSETVRFSVDIWRNADPEKPFASRQPDTPTYRFYVDLSESRFRELLRIAIIEERRVTGDYVPAIDKNGNPVEPNWYDHASSGGD